jgi:allophanate hydrolase subunit 2
MPPETVSGYLAIEGGFGFLPGSTSTNGAAIGGFLGRLHRRRAASELNSPSRAEYAIALRSTSRSTSLFSGPRPQADYFTEEAIATFLSRGQRRSSRTAWDTG